MTAAWKHHLGDVVRSVAELLDILGLDRGQLPPLMDGADQFALRVPRDYVRRMRRGDPRDPLLRQVLPVAEEAVEVPGFTTDPVGEWGTAGGVLRKYHGRSLLIVTGACAVHCRYCFRRHFPYAGESVLAGGIDRALKQLADDAACREVILSGGDPLTMDDVVLGKLVARIEALPHVVRLRVHSRLPVVVPARIDDAMLDWLAGGRLQPVMVIHANHANEVDHEVAHAVARLRRAGVTVFNQAVLLTGVNDTADALANLSEKLFAAGVVPYYLHCLDRVAGAAHFEVSEDAAVSLVEELRERLPGYLVPRLVREVAGAPAKRPVTR